MHSNESGYMLVILMAMIAIIGSASLAAAKSYRTRALLAHSIENRQAKHSLNQFVSSKYSCSNDIHPQPSTCTTTSAAHSMPIQIGRFEVMFRCSPQTDQAVAVLARRNAGDEFHPFMELEDECS